MTDESRAETLGATAFAREDLVFDTGADVGQPICLRASTCPQCGRTEFPALSECPSDGTGSEPTGLGPKAELAGFTEILHPPPGAMVDVPYTLAVARFPQNICVIGRLVSHVPVDQLAVGDPVEVVMTTYQAGRTYGFRVLDDTPSGRSGPFYRPCNE